MTTWLTTQVEAVTDGTAVLVLTQADYDAIAPDVIGPLAKAEDFAADVALAKCCWFYHAKTQKRGLILLYKPKDGAKPHDLLKEIRGVAKKAAGELQGKKILKALFFLSSSISNLKESAGHFVNAFDSANYEVSFKRPEEKKDASADPRTQRHEKNVTDYTVHLEDASILTSEEYKFQLAAAKAIEKCKVLTRTRGSTAVPKWMHDEAKKIADAHPDMIKEFRVLKGKELPDNGMNLFWNVGKAAACEPYCVMIHYQGRPEDDTVDFAVVGKGVTYDTGGLNIKMMMMEMMYEDKGGSCAVLGSLLGCLELKLKKNIVFACAFAENAIGADAYKPNDILTAMNGLTVEVANTDAEGRLVMSDTMTYVQRHFKPKKVAYIATLTGACIIALGKTTAAVFSTDDDMVKSIKKASDEAFEPVWHMPLNDEFRDSIKGKYGSDISNLGETRWGGACTAAAFLERFIEDERPWMHIDIAGPTTFAEKDASGFGAKLLLQYINNL